MPRAARKAQATRSALLVARLFLGLAILCLCAALWQMSSVAMPEMLRALSLHQRVVFSYPQMESEGSFIAQNGQKKADNNSTGNPDTPASNYGGFDVGETSESNANQASLPDAKAGGKASLIGSGEEELTSMVIEPRRTDSLTDAPIAELTEKTQWGVLPVKSASSNAWEAYRRAFTAAKPAKPAIGVVILHYASQKNISERLLALPPEVTLAVNPYAANRDGWMQNARRLGHEVWLMLPAEAEDYPASDPGPLGMLLDMHPDTELWPRLAKLLALPQGYVGLVLAAQERVSSQPSFLKWLGEQLSKRGLGLVLANPPKSRNSLDWLATQKQISIAQFSIEHPQLPAALNATFAEAEARAKQQGRAMVVIKPYPAHLAALENWLTTLAGKGMVIAPASAVVDGGF